MCVKCVCCAACVWLYDWRKACALLYVCVALRLAQNACLSLYIRCSMIGAKCMFCSMCALHYVCVACVLLCDSHKICVCLYACVALWFVKVCVDHVLFCPCVVVRCSVLQCVGMCMYAVQCGAVCMWLRLVGSLRLRVSLAEYRLFCRALLHNIVSFVGLFCKRDLCEMLCDSWKCVFYCMFVLLCHLGTVGVARTPSLSLSLSPTHTHTHAHAHAHALTCTRAHTRT